MARIAFACMTAITIAAAGPALAQTATDPSAPATTGAPMSGMSMPMPAEAPAAPAAAPAAPAPDAAPAVPVEPPAEPAPPPMPTTGIAAQINNLLTNACIPMIRAPGTDPKSIAKQTGLRMVKGEWMMKLDKINTITVRLPNSVNPSNCSMDLTYDPGQGPTIVAGLTAWAANQPVPLNQDKVADTTQEVDGQYTTTNWVGYSASTRMGLSLTEKKKLDGSSYGKNADVASVQFSFRGLTSMDRQ